MVNKKLSCSHYPTSLRPHFISTYRYIGTRFVHATGLCGRRLDRPNKNVQNRTNHKLDCNEIKPTFEWPTWFFAFPVPKILMGVNKTHNVEGHAYG